MQMYVKGLIGLSALAFVLAVIAVYTGPILVVTAEGFSRACTNLALIAIALSLCLQGKAPEK